MQVLAQEIISLSKKKLESIVHDAAKSARAVNLVYVNDAEQGIRRIKKGKGFTYTFQDKKVTDAEVLQRIKSLVIPPAWKQVWICAIENGHLQATGLDARKRKQYRYHPLWNSLRNHTKFHRLAEFGESLPAMRLQIEKDLSLPGMPQEKILAAVVSLMERTSIRVGNSFYEKLYGSFGLTTLKDKHVQFEGTRMSFKFKGKKGVAQSISIKSRKLANIVKKCRDIPGKELFQYYDDEGAHKSIDSGMVNGYIKKISGKDFSAKDFRTWAGTVQALLAFKCIGYGQTQTETKKKIVEALDMVSTHLGNTRTVCKKYYVHPVIISLFENKCLENYFDELDKIEKDDNVSGLAQEEKVLMKILAKEV